MDSQATSGYSEFVTHLERLATTATGPERDSLVEAALDGLAGSELRRLVPIETRRAAGAFFTADAWRKEVEAAVARHGCQPPYYDPASGSGDLLIAAARGAVSQGIAVRWARDLRGVDLAEEFVAAARLRLSLLASSMGARPMSASSFRQVTKADGMVPPRLLPRTILLNPPFGSSPAPEGCGWGAGLVPRAAVFMDRVLDWAPTDSTVIALLPDVLRSGSRSRRWRCQVASRLEIVEIRTLGQFDAWTDVDIFMLVGKVREQPQSDSDAEWAKALTTPVATVGDRFEVSVGPVVDYRDAREGAEHPYLTPRSLPMTGSFKVATDMRPYSGRLLAPPFVAVRRTDRPRRQGRRCISVSIELPEPVAVDNHLLVVKPRSGRVSECRALAKHLASDEVRDYLDERIRCRHLTVEAVRSIPLRP